MMLGMAASISIAVPSGRRSHTGESSVRNVAMPKLTGIAMMSAMADGATVPAIGTSAPNCSCTGSQLSSHRNGRPKRRIDGIAPTSSETTIAPSRLKTTNAKNRVTFRKIASIQALLRSIGGRGAERAAPEGAAAKLPLSSTAVMLKHGLARSIGDRLPRRADFLRHVLRHRHVVELRGDFSAVAERPVEELEHLPSGVGLLLLRMQEDERRTRDGPGLVARLVGEHHAHALHRLPVRVRCGGLERLVRGRHECAAPVLHLAVCELVLLGVRVLDVADGAVDLLHVRRDASVALSTPARRPLDRRALAHLVREFRAHLRDVVGPEEGRARAVGAM